MMTLSIDTTSNVIPWNWAKLQNGALNIYLQCRRVIDALLILLLSPRSVQIVSAICTTSQWVKLRLCYIYRRFMALVVKFKHKSNGRAQK